jgi:FlgN protein
MDKLSQILWRERELLETLLFKLEEEQLVLAAGRSRWLARAAGEVEQVLGTIRETEILRAVAADDVAARLGLASNPSLRTLADAVDEPWSSLLADHHDAFTMITREIVALADANRELITIGYRSARETLLSLGDSAQAYAADGSAVAVSDARRPMVDWSL